jgi:hypothetical protein
MHFSAAVLNGNDTNTAFFLVPVLNILRTSKGCYLLQDILGSGGETNPTKQLIYQD